MHMGKFARAEAAEHEEWYQFSTWCTHHLPPASVVSYIYVALLSLGSKLRKMYQAHSDTLWWEPGNKSVL